MRSVGVRALKQNASAVVADAAAGEVITITDRGRAVAQIVPLPRTRADELIAAGMLRPARGSLRDLPPPPDVPLVEGRSVSEILAEMRADER